MRLDSSDDMLSRLSTRGFRKLQVEWYSCSPRERASRLKLLSMRMMASLEGKMLKFMEVKINWIVHISSFRAATHPEFWVINFLTLSLPAVCRVVSNWKYVPAAPSRNNTKCRFSLFFIYGTFLTFLSDEVRLALSLSLCVCRSLIEYKNKYISHFPPPPARHSFLVYEHYLPCGMK